VTLRLDDLVEVFDESAFPDARSRDHPDRSSVVAARTAVTAAVRDDEFLVECMAHELQTIRDWIPRRGLVPFFSIAGRGIRFAFGYWPPGANAGAHEHTAWTITAVCRNHLEVQTYDRNESYRHQVLVPKHRFDAPAGEVGYIYDPCIHDPRNVTHSWSLSFHATSPLDGAQLANQDGCLPALDAYASRLSDTWGEPYDTVITARRRQLVIRQIAQFLSRVDGCTAGGLLESCLRLGTSSTRRFVRGLGRCDATAGGRAQRSRLTRTHPDLVLSCRNLGDRVSLGGETSRGWVEEMSVSVLAREALEFCARTTSFAVDELPGRLSDDERRELGEALEDSGLYRGGN
jgi:hypothetical protein